MEEEKKQSAFKGAQKASWEMLLEVAADVQEELLVRATQDSLTGLVNREFTERDIVSRLENMKPESVCALFMIDLDNFKQVNDKLGHPVGDDVLRKTAAELSNFFRSTDIVGRLGGDEFIAFIGDRISADAAREKAQALCEVLQFTVGVHPSVQLTASVGVCMAKGVNLTFDELYTRADAVLYKAKKAGKNQYCMENMKDGSISGRAIPAPASTIQLRALLEYMDGGIELLEIREQEIRVIYVSPSFCRMMNVDAAGYTLPRQLAEVKIHASDLPGYEEILRQGARSGEAVDFVYRNSPDGKKWHWRHTRAVRIEYDASEYPVMLAVITDISELKRKDEMLQESNERLRIAFNQTEQLLWEVDIEKQTFGVFDVNTQAYVPGTLLSDFPESLIAKHWVHPDFSNAFRKFGEALLRGNENGNGTFVMRYGEDAYGWVSLLYHTMFHGRQRPAKAIGIWESLPDISGAQHNFLMKGRLLEVMSPGLVASLKVNLTEDQVELLWEDGKNRLPKDGNVTYTEIMENGASRLFDAEECERYQKCFGRQSLQDAFNRGEMWVSMEYRRMNLGGEARWISNVVCLAENPVTRDLYAFAFIRDIEKRRQWEESVGICIRRDPVSMLYDETTTRQLVEYLLASEGRKRAMCTLTLVQLVDPDAQTLPAYSEKDRVFLGTVFSVFLDADCIVGQYDADRIVVFCPRILSGSVMRQRIQDTILMVRNAGADTGLPQQVSFAAAVVCSRRKRADYESMLSKAARACARSKCRGKDVIVVTNAYEKNDFPIFARPEATAVQLIPLSERPKALMGVERAVQFSVMEGILSAETIEESVQYILCQLGQYYLADRVYILGLPGPRETASVVDMMYEWTGKGMHSLRHWPSGASFEDFPLLRRCVETGQAVCAGTGAQENKKSGTHHSYWRYMMLPIRRSDEICTFLCIDNPREHFLSISLAAVLMQFLLHEQSRFEKVNTRENTRHVYC